MRCSACHEECAPADTSCPSCGQRLDPGDTTGQTKATGDESTRASRRPTSFETAPAPPPSESKTATRGGHATNARHVPGTVIDGRYRIVAILGRGGMGEVYRADDLKLGQAVALKFLPSALEHDETRLAMLLDEVRVARRVAHPNVCRVYDVGESDGHHFISMEYVDGEDLAALLRRIGRLPRDKAAQIARQLCAGLAAAHELGIVHRDLKPANIMIDGRGRARITDFGLARETETVAGQAARDGTPAYMAPEQLAGREATARSDIYALGLVLYELFTGQQPFSARSRDDAIHERSSGPPPSPSSHVDTLDPAADAIIMRCLEPEPAQRPQSALGVAAALPGGDPLAAALAAGETPSPEMVAAAPTEAAISPAVAIAAVAFCLVAVAVGEMLEFSRGVGPGGRSPIVLADRAAGILRELGQDIDGHDSAWGYSRQPRPAARPLFDQAEVAAMAAGERPPYFTFWYRSSPTPLIPWVGLQVSSANPPRGDPNSALVTLDTDGDLIGLEIWPARSSIAGSGDAVDWAVMLEMAGLDASTLRPSDNPTAPPMFADELAAWSGNYAGGSELRVKAAATAGQPRWLRIFSPELGDAEPVREALPVLFLALLLALFVLILAAGLRLARTNLRSGRGDRAGAWRIALLVGGSWLLYGVLAASHRSGIDEVLLLYRLFTGSMVVTVLTWMFYLGLEPMLRRNWPHRIVAWSRALEGRFADPLVGLHLLAGAVGATLMAYLDEFGLYLGQAAGLPPRAWAVFVPAESGWRLSNFIAGWPLALAAGVMMALAFAVMLLVVARAVRSEVLGAWIFAIVLAFGLALRDQVTDPGILIGLLISTWVMAEIFLRFGLLASAATSGLAHLIILSPTTQYSENWLSTGSTVLAFTTVVVAAYGARIATRSARGRGRVNVGRAVSQQ